MSNYWGYECITCNDRTEDDLNHGGDILRDFATKAYPHLRAAMRDCGAAKGWIEIGFMGHPIMFLFLCGHDGHQINLTDEYGYSEALNIPPPLEVE